MSEPEIARRCLVCGASVRARTAFCPHCGNAFPDESSGGEVSASPEPLAGLDAPISGRAAVTKNKAASNKRRVVTATAAAREHVGENLRPRVEKLRQTSSAMLDEAADDPGLRFVLIAAALFALTLALVVLSKLLS
jgi:hypothetical protein